jgi:hypothetical protein
MDRNRQILHVGNCEEAGAIWSLMHSKGEKPA